MADSDLSSAALTYPEVGATRDTNLPLGYAHVHRDVALGHGRAAFERAADTLTTWRMHRRAGLTVAVADTDADDDSTRRNAARADTANAAPARAATGAVVMLRAGWGPLRLTIPCRVVYTIEEADRRGFAYGTLPGHPERGEERFTVELTESGEVRFRIRAFSRPAALLARAGGPVTRLVQEYVTDRYVRAVRDDPYP